MQWEDIMLKKLSKSGDLLIKSWKKLVDNGTIKMTTGDTKLCRDCKFCKRHLGFRVYYMVVYTNFLDAILRKMLLLIR